MVCVGAWVALAVVVVRCCVSGWLECELLECLSV